MTIYQPGQRFETLTNQQLVDRLRQDGEVRHVRFLEPITLRVQDFKRELALLDCDFTQGLILLGNRILQDVSFEGSRLAGKCVLDFFTAKIVSLTQLDAEAATLHFERITVAPNENADVWLSLKPGTAPPRVVTDNKVIKEMFRQLPHAKTLVSYQEIHEEFE